MAATATAAVMAAATTAAARPNRKARRGTAKHAAPPLYQLERVKRQVRERVCSEPWVEAVVMRGTPYAPDAPCWCERCKGVRRWPRGYVGSNGLAYECVLDDLPDWRKRLLPGSTSAISMRRLKSARARGEEYRGGL